MLDTNLNDYSFEVFTFQERRIINLPYFAPHVMKMKSEQGEVLTWNAEGKNLVIHYLFKTDRLTNFPVSLLNDLVEGKAELVVKSALLAQDYQIKAH